MIFTERYAEILKTVDFFKKEYGDDVSVENNIIDNVDIVVTGHFGNCVSLTMTCENICPIPLYNSTNNIGYIIKALIELLDKEDDNSVSIKEFAKTPIRLVFIREKPIAIGHFIKDRFFIIEDLMHISK